MSCGGSRRSLSFVVMLLSFYVFGLYDHDAGGYQFLRAWQWLEIPGPWPFGDQGITLSLGVDGISAMMVLLTGIVMFTGTLISWSIRRPQQGLLHPVLPVALGRVRGFRVAGPVLPVLLLRARSAADVPVDRRLGEQFDLQRLHPHEGIRRDEAHAVPRRRERADLDSAAGDIRRGQRGDVRSAGP